MIADLLLEICDSVLVDSDSLIELIMSSSSSSTSEILSVNSPKERYPIEVLLVICFTSGIGILGLGCCCWAKLDFFISKLPFFSSAYILFMSLTIDS